MPAVSPLEGGVTPADVVMSDTTSMDVSAYDPTKPIVDQIVKIAAPGIFRAYREHLEAMTLTGEELIARDIDRLAADEFRH